MTDEIRMEDRGTARASRPVALYERLTLTKTPGEVVRSMQNDYRAIAGPLGTRLRKRTTSV